MGPRPGGAPLLLNTRGNTTLRRPRLLAAGAPTCASWDVRPDPAAGAGGALLVLEHDANGLSPQELSEWLGLEGAEPGRLSAFAHAVLRYVGGQQPHWQLLQWPACC